MAIKRVRTRFDARKLKQAMQKANFRSLSHASGAIRLTARRSIRQSPKYAPPGGPPNTRRGQLRNAIVYDVSTTKLSAVIGPDVQAIGTSGSAHEFGGEYKKQTYEKRPFMGPALEKVRSRIPAFWSTSLKP